MDKRLEAVGRLLDIMDELREKCPWDRKQTFDSLRMNTIEETYELADAILAEISTAAQPPADGALNTIAAMFHSAEEIEGPDGLAMMVDMSVWNDALDAFDEISGDEMEPTKEQA